MTWKGPSPVDLESAEPTSRRGLFAALGAAGIAGAAALAVARPAQAAPTSPTAGDAALLRQAMELELTARDLYRAAADAGLADEAALLASTFAANHASYADEIAGMSGFSANTRNDDVFDENEAAFSGGDDDVFVEAAMALENTAAATHAALMGEYESVDATTVAAAIAVVEARMATVLAELGGLAGDLDTLLEPEAEPIDVGGGA